MMGEGDSSTGPSRSITPELETDNEMSSDSSLCSAEPICSTPIKRNSRMSVSLNDVSQVDFPLSKSEAISCDTLRSQSSMDKSKDSGYDQSVSSLSVNSVEQHRPRRSYTMFYNETRLTVKTPKCGRCVSESDMIRQSYNKLKEELDFKNVMISTLQESNNHLRMKLAIAENKISELRLRCEQHCKCCSKNGHLCSSKKEYGADKYNNLYPFVEDEKSTLEVDTVYEHPQCSEVYLKEDPHAKVERWQNSFDDSGLIENIEEPDELNLDVVKSCQPFRNGSATDFRVFGKQSVSVSTQRHFFEERGKAAALSKSSALAKVPLRSSLTVSKPITVPLGERTTARVSISKKFSDQYNRGKEVPDLVSQASDRIKRVYREQLATHTENKLRNSRSLYDCISQADEYATEMSLRLSKIPGQLDYARSLGKDFLY